MGEQIQVSSQRTVITRVLMSMLGVLISGRLLVVEHNKFYVFAALFYFLASVGMSGMWIMYAQWRARHGWVSTVELPDRRED